MKPCLALLLLTLLPYTSLSLGFILNAYSSEMCFILKGSDVGKKLMLDYTVLAERGFHLHFTIFDMDAQEMIFEEKRDNMPSVNVQASVNFLHNFEVCWKNVDSEEKRVNFSYKHTVELPLDSKDVNNHFDMIEEFLDKGEDIKDLLSSEDEQQVRLHKSLNVHEENINRLFFFKALFLFLIVLLQVFILSKLVDSNVKEIKTIVIGPN